jgi:hypothetical protein
VQTATAYLETLNPEQRRAVEHGAAGGLAAPPLLVTAGAGSGKTNTLAHRVAHLIVQGADLRRILLMTFSRRAASEMTKRVERIARKVTGDNAALAQGAVMPDELGWDFSGPDDAKAVIRAAVRYLLEGAAGSDRGDIVREIIGIVDEVARGLPPGQDPFDDELPGG